MRPFLPVAFCALAALSASAHAAIFNLTGSFGTADLTLPSGSAIDDQGKLYVTEFATGTNWVRVFDTHTQTLVNTLGAGTLISPAGIVAAPDGNLYIGDVTRILPMSKSGVPGTPIGAGVVDGVYAITADTSNNLFATDIGPPQQPQGPSLLRSYTTSGTPRFAMTSANGINFNGLFGLAMDDSHLYICDTFNNRIVIDDLNGNYISSFTPLLETRPGSIAIHSGILFIAFRDYLSAWTTDGTLLESYAMNGPYLSFSGDTLYATSARDHTVYIFGVPEPASLALLAGASVLLLLPRRRHG